MQKRNPPLFLYLVPRLVNGVQFGETYFLLN